MWYRDFIDFVRSIYGNDFIPLHRPVFDDSEKNNLVECIDSNFVSSVGYGVKRFEDNIAKFTGHKFAVATVNGTSALHIALHITGVQQGDEVITQALTFVATANAISYCSAKPIFIDVDIDTLGMSPKALSEWLSKNTIQKNGLCINKTTGSIIKACVPMHTFGLPCRANEISKICKKFNLKLIEDTAESLGSFIKHKHTGTHGDIATFSFNGNKIITTGGGGMIVTNNKKTAEVAKHLTTTAKIDHPYEFNHDQVGYNYRMPNINAVLGLSQMKKLNHFLSIKKDLANYYHNFFSSKKNVKFVNPVAESDSNFWLNAILLPDIKHRDDFLKETNDRNIMTRPIWTPLNKLPMFKECECGPLATTSYLEERIVNIPSSVPSMNWSSCE